MGSHVNRDNFEDPIVLDRMWSPGIVGARLPLPAGAYQELRTMALVPFSTRIPAHVLAAVNVRSKEDNPYGRPNTSSVVTQALTLGLRAMGVKLDGPPPAADPAQLTIDDVTAAHPIVGDRPLVIDATKLPKAKARKVTAARERDKNPARTFARAIVAAVKPTKAPHRTKRAPSKKGGRK